MKRRSRSGRAAPQDWVGAERRFLQIRFPRQPQAVIFFPAPYPAAIANLGFLTIWERLNAAPGFSCDRAVWDPQAEAVPRGLQTGLPLSAFPLIFISSSFELDLVSLVDALLAAGIEPNAVRRGQSGPLIVAGGITLTLNPAPWAPFIDLAILGEGERAALDWLQIYLNWRAARGTKKELIEQSAGLPFIWAPTVPDRDVIPAEYLNYPDDPACSSAVHPRAHFGDCWLVEISRGCPRDCRFCAVCRAYRPRFGREAAILRKMEESGALSAPKVGLVGAAAGDYPNLKRLIKRIVETRREITISSLRIERTDEELLSLLASGGFRTLTVAPEAGGEKLRRTLGKKSSDDDLVRLVQAAGRAGLRKVRLYFLIGLPDPEPPEAIIHLVQLLRREASSSLKLDLSVSSFVPKPGMPWERADFAPTNDLNEVKRALSSAVGRMPGVSVRFESTRRERLAALLSRGDHRLGQALLDARRSARPLEQQLRLSGADPDDLLRPSGPMVHLPWHFIRRSLR